MPPLPPLSELLALDEPERVRIIQASVEAASSFGEPQARLLRELGQAQISARVTRDHLPIPAIDDRQGYLGDDHLAYWVSGLGDSMLLARIAKERSRGTMMASPDRRPRPIDADTFGIHAGAELSEGAGDTLVEGSRLTSYGHNARRSSLR